MATIVTRSGKGSPLTHAEVDSNFTNLNTDKLETAGGTMTGNLSFGDNDKAIFGAGSDLQIYHDGATSFIDDAGTGNLVVKTNGGGILLLSNDDNLASFVSDGAVNLYYDNSKKLATTSTGVDITGTLTSDGLTVDGDGLFNGGFNDPKTITLNSLRSVQDNVLGKILFQNTSNDVAEIYANSGPDGTNRDEGKLIFRTAEAGGTMRSRMLIDYTGDISFYEDTGTTAKFFWDASAEKLGLGTTSPATSIQVVESGGTPEIRLADGTNAAGLGVDTIPFVGAISNTHFAIKTNNTERMRIDSSGNLIVGGTTDGAAGSITLQNDGDIRGVLASGAGGDTLISAISGVSNGYQIVVDASNNQSYRWHNGGTQSMTLDSSGNLLVGKTSTGINTAGTRLIGGGSGAQFTADGTEAIALNRLTSDGDLIWLGKAGSKVGSIGTENHTGFSSTYIEGVANSSGLFFGNQEILPSRNAVLTNGFMDLGDGNYRFKDLYLSGGVVFGATSGSVTSKTLDDYEEGTFTPSFSNLTIGNGSVFGTYTKIGRSVTVIFGFDCGSTTSVGTLGDITGLPFTSSNDYIGFIKVHGVAFDSGSRWYEAVAVIGNNNSTVLVPSTTNYNSSISATNPMTWTTNDNLVFTATYTTT